MNFGQYGKSFALVAAFTLAAQTAVSAGAASPAATTACNVQAQVEQGKAALRKGQLDVAISTLSKAAKVLGTKPGSCDCHYNLGVALCKKAKTEGSDKAATDFFAAKKELRTAIRVGAGNEISKQANMYLMANLPAGMLSPRAGEGTELIAARLGLRKSDRAVGGALPKPKVFEFYADWCEPCTKLKPVLAKLKEQYGDQIEVQSINVDDKANAEIVDQYDVSPIPTVIYMNPDGQVMGYSIGVSDEKLLHKELQKILPNKG